MSTPSRREPDGGYDFSAKRHYRREKWAFVDRACKGRVPLRQRTVLYLDTKEGHETEALLRRGYLAKNLHAVNWIPAELAVLNQRLKREQGVMVNSHGVSLDRAIADTAGFIDVYDCDLTTTTDRAKATLRETTRCGKPDRVVIATVQCGREGESILRRAINAIGALGRKPLTTISQSSDGLSVQSGMTWNHMLRLGHLVLFMTQLDDDNTPCHSHVLSMRHGKYVSTSGHAMLWCAARLTAHTDDDVNEIVTSARGGSLGQEAAMAVVASVPMTPWCLMNLMNRYSSRDHLKKANESMSLAQQQFSGRVIH